jgi:broad specificity phosphatase PhoE
MIRHGRRTEGLDRGLTAEGRAQAEALRHRLRREYALERGTLAVYSSVLPRAVETAEFVAAGLRQGADDVIQDCDLCTYHLPAELVPVGGGGVYLPFEQGNESWSDLVNRVGKALSRIAARHSGTTTAIVAHDCVVEASLVVFGALPLLRAFDIAVDYASITEWTTTDDPAAEWDAAASPWPPARWRLERLNDTAHLAR